MALCAVAELVRPSAQPVSLGVAAARAVALAAGRRAVVRRVQGAAPTVRPGVLYPDGTFKLISATNLRKKIVTLKGTLMTCFITCLVLKFVTP